MISALLRWLIDQGHLATLPAADLAVLLGHIQAADPLPGSELDKVIKARTNTP